MKTPASFWTYKAPPTPSYEHAVRVGAIRTDKISAASWEQLTPGMRRTIVREHVKSHPLTFTVE